MDMHFLSESNSRSSMISKVRLPSEGVVIVTWVGLRDTRV